MPNFAMRSELEVIVAAGNRVSALRAFPVPGATTKLYPARRENTQPYNTSKHRPPVCMRLAILARCAEALLEIGVVG